MRTAIIWQRTQPLSTEHCVIESATDAISITGLVIHSVDERPHQTRYTITLDPQWRTREVTIQIATLDATRKLHLRSDGNGEWWVNGVSYPALQGCIDIDLGITPATNTLPIRRLHLQPGQAAEVEAAWVRFPTLDIEWLPQRYTCLASDRYHYQSGNFTALLLVDAEGIVRDYENVWHAAALDTD